MKVWLKRGVALPMVRRLDFVVVYWAWDLAIDHWSSVYTCWRIMATPSYSRSLVSLTKRLKVRTGNDTT